MKRIIDELLASEKRELGQVGLTPRTNFDGTQEQHDAIHVSRAKEYADAAKILQSKYATFDWLTSYFKHFDSYKEAKSEYLKMIQNAGKSDCDVQLLAVIEECNNIK